VINLDAARRLSRLVPLDAARRLSRLVDWMRREGFRAYNARQMPARH
jgi:hypothetical protein